MKPLDGPIRSVELVFEFLGAMAMLVTVLVVTLDVFMRYFINSPLPWSNDVLSLYFIPTFFFFGLSGAYMRGAHISVDILLRQVPKPIQAAFILIGRCAGMSLFTLILIYGAEHTYDSYMRVETLPGWVSYPVWPSTALVPLGSALMIIRIIQSLLSDVLSLARTGEIPFHDPEEGVPE